MSALPPIAAVLAAQSHCDALLAWLRSIEERAPETVTLTTGQVVVEVPTHLRAIYHELVSPEVTTRQRGAARLTAFLTATGLS